MAEKTLAIRSGQADVHVTPLAQLRTDVAVIPSVTGNQLVRSRVGEGLGGFKAGQRAGGGARHQQHMHAHLTAASSNRCICLRDTGCSAPPTAG